MVMDWCNVQKFKFHCNQEDAALKGIPKPVLSQVHCRIHPSSYLPRRPKARSRCPFQYANENRVHSARHRTRVTSQFIDQLDITSHHVVELRWKANKGLISHSSFLFVSQSTTM